MQQVCLVTGSNTGMGKEVARILYSKNATVYVAARDEGKGLAAIDDIKKAHPQSKGILRFLQLDLADLAAVSTSADQFLASERRLDLLFNNAGVMHPPESWKTKQGYDMMLGVNCVGHFLLTKKLTPLLQKAGADSPKGTVRIIFVSSSAATLSAPKEGVPLDNIDYKTPKDTLYRYGVSKAGNYLQATEFAKRYKNDNIISVVSHMTECLGLRTW